MEIHDTESEFLPLYDEVLALLVPNSQAVLIEHGSGSGAGAVYMTKHFQRHEKQAKIFCIDYWNNVPGDAWRKEWRTIPFSEFCQQTALYSGVITGFTGVSADCAGMFPDRSVDAVIFRRVLDYTSFRQALMQWKTKLKFNGIMIGVDATSDFAMAALQDQLPWRQVNCIDSKYWIYRNNIQIPGTWLNQVEIKFDEISPHIIAIPCVTNDERLNKAVTSILQSGVNLLVVDSSGKNLALEKYSWFRKVQVFRTAEKVEFTQVQNLFQLVAFEKSYKWLGFMHSDASCIHINDGTNFLKYATEKMEHNPLCAGVFTAYDALCLFNLEVLKKVGVWDETYTWYFADNDYYDRCRLYGFDFDVWPEHRNIYHVVSGSSKDDVTMAAIASREYNWGAAHHPHKWNTFRNLSQAFKETLIPYGLP